MSGQSVIKWRKVTKERLVAGLGGKCNRCGYNRCFDCLHFHHFELAGSIPAAAA